MQFEGEFRVPGDPDTVLRRFADVERMARCMPGATLEGPAIDGRYPGAMIVAFGPKKIKFVGKVSADVDASAHTGRLHVSGGAEMRTAARAVVDVVYTVRTDVGATIPTSIVSLTSTAQMGGVLADFARTGGEAVMRVLMDSFAARVAEEFAQEAPTQVPTEPVLPLSPCAPDPPPLSMRDVLQSVLVAKVRTLIARLRAAMQRS